MKVFLLITVISLLSQAKYDVVFNKDVHTLVIEFVEDQFTAEEQIEIRKSGFIPVAFKICYPSKEIISIEYSKAGSYYQDAAGLNRLHDNHFKKIADMLLKEIYVKEIKNVPEIYTEKEIEITVTVDL